MVDVAQQAAQPLAASAPEPVPPPIPTPVQPGATPLPAAGWYVDPVDALQRRWWSGTEWTGHVRTIVEAQAGYVGTPSVVPTPSAVPAFGLASNDARSSIRELADELSGVRSATRPVRAAAPVPMDHHGTVAATRPTVPWFEKPERNATATAGFVFGVLAIVLNPAAIMTVLALLLSGIGLAKSSGTFRSVGRRRAIWGLLLGVVGGLVWGAATWWALQHPEILASVGIDLS